MTRRTTLLALLALGGSAAADTPAPSTADVGRDSLAVESRRGVAEDYQVMPRGGELTAQLRFVTADSMAGGDALKFTDLALFGLSGSWALFERLQLGASVDLLPKQPSTSDEHVWQSVGFSAKAQVRRRLAVKLAGGGGHLLSHSGKWMQQSLTLEWKKPIHEILSFNVQGGVSALGLDAPTSMASAHLTEVGVHTTAMFRDPYSKLGAWVGVGYAVPVRASGSDPTTGMAIDPQPRLGFHGGGVLSLVKQWDLYLDIAIMDRGDAADPATRLPILDGGFDQTQIIFGLTRHLEAPRKRSTPVNDPLYLGSL